MWYELVKLTVRKIQTEKGPARLTDEHGLYRRVSPRGAKGWIQRLTIQGSRTDNAMGHYPSMGLAEARAGAFERWKIARAGGDPRHADGAVAHSHARPEPHATTDAPSAASSAPAPR